MAIARTRYVSEYVIDTARALGPSRDLDQQLGKTTKGAGLLKGALGGIAAGFSVAVVVAGLKQVGDLLFAQAKAGLEAWGVQESAIRQVEAAIASTGGVAGLTSQEIQDLASELQKITTVSDEVTLSAAAVLLTFTSINRDAFPDTIALAQDMAVRLGEAGGSVKDVKAQATLLGKALNDPILGLSALQRVGVQFTEGQKDTIKTLVEGNDLYGAQAVILSELQTQFGGAAKAARDTLPGAYQAASNITGDLTEQIGEGLSPAVRVVTEEWITFLTALNDSGRVREGVEALSLALVSALEPVGLLLAKYLDWFERNEKLILSLTHFVAQLTGVTGLLAAVKEFSADLDDSSGAVGRNEAAWRNLIARIREASETSQSGGSSWGALSGAQGAAALTSDELAAALKRQQQALDALISKAGKLQKVYDDLAAARNAANLDSIQPIGGPEPTRYLQPTGRSYTQELADSYEEDMIEASDAWVNEALIEWAAQWAKGVSVTSELLLAGLKDAFRGAKGDADELGYALGSALRGALDDVVGAFVSGEQIDWKEVGSSLLQDAGAAVGEYYGGPLGAAVGEVVGKLVGDFLGLGDKLNTVYAALIGEGGQLSAEIGQGTGQLEGLVGSVLGVLIDSFNDIAESLGGALVGLESTFAFQVEEKGGEIKRVKVWVDNVLSIFETVEEAIAFLTGELLSRARFSGLEPEVVAVLRDAAGKSLEEIDRTIGAAVRVAAGRVGDHATAVAADFREIIDDYFTVLLAGGDPNAGTQGRLRALRDDIQGVQLSQEQIYERRKAAFNLELDLAALELRSKLDALRLSGQIIEQEIDLTRLDLEMKGRYVQGLAGVVGATANAAAQLEIILQALANLEELRITDADIPTFRGGGGADIGASTRAAERERREAQLAELAILEALAAGDQEEADRLRRRLDLERLAGQGLTESEAARWLELEAIIAGREAAEEAAAAWLALSQSLLDQVEDLLGPDGLDAVLTDIIARFGDARQQVLDEVLALVGEGNMASILTLFEEGRFDEINQHFGENVAELLLSLGRLDEGLEAALLAFGQETLDGLAGEITALGNETAATQAQIRFLLEHLEQLGVTAGDVAAAVREGIVPDLLAIGEAQARRVGDEEAAARFAERRARMERLIERLRFESMVATLQLAGALDAELRGIIRETRALFFLPDAPGSSGGGGGGGGGGAASQGVSAVKSLREELARIIETAERGQLGPARQQLEQIFDTFARAGSLLRTVSASGAEWARTARAMASELSDFWRALVTDPAQERLDRIRQQRQSPAQQFQAARAAFQGLDLGNLSELDPDEARRIFEVLDRFQAAGTAQFGEGFGSTVVGRQVEAALEQLIGLVPSEDDLLLQAIQHLEAQVAERLDAGLGASGPIAQALTAEEGVAAELRALADQIDDAAIAAGLDDLADALLSGEINLADAGLIASLDTLRDQLDPGSPLELQISGLIDQLLAGVAVDTGTLADSLSGLAGLLGDGNESAADLLRSIAAELTAGTLSIDDSALRARLFDVLAALGPNHPLHDVLGTIFENLGGSLPYLAPLTDPLGPTAAVAKFAAKDFLLQTSMERDLDRLADVFAGQDDSNKGAPSSTLAVTMQSLWGTGSPVLKQLAAIEKAIVSQNLSAGGS